MTEWIWPKFVNITENIINITTKTNLNRWILLGSHRLTSHFAIQDTLGMSHLEALGIKNVQTKRSLLQPSLAGFPACRHPWSFETSFCERTQLFSNQSIILLFNQASFWSFLLYYKYLCNPSFYILHIYHNKSLSLKPLIILVRFY